MRSRPGRCTLTPAIRKRRIVDHGFVRGWNFISEPVVRVRCFSTTLVFHILNHTVWHAAAVWLEGLVLCCRFFVYGVGQALGIAFRAGRLRGSMNNGANIDDKPIKMRSLRRFGRLRGGLWGARRIEEQLTISRLISLCKKLL